MSSVPSGWLSVLRVLAASAVVSLVVFLLGETALRVAGIGWSGRFFLDNPDGTTVTNPRFGRLFYPEELLRGAYPAKFAARRPEGVLRVFVLGESAVAGTPEPSFSVSRILGTLLRKACPDTDFEVINTGVTALNSHAVRLIAREIVRYEPDAVIVYLGNNEVVGPFGPGSVLGGGAIPNGLVRPLLWFRSTRVGQLIQWLADISLSSGLPRIWQGMDMFADAYVPAGHASMPIVYKNFADNLRDIATFLREKQVPVLLCTVASNIVDCPPLGPGEGGTDKFAHDFYDQAKDALVEDRSEVALRLFREARDRDTLRFRADSRINAITREVAQQTRCDFLDVEALLAEAQVKGGYLAYPLFFEHVHFTFEGNVLFASLLAEWLSGLWVESLPCLSKMETLAHTHSGEIGKELGYSVLARGYSIGAIVDMLRKAPFRNQPGNDQKLRFWQGELRAIEEEMTPEYLAAWTARLHELSAANPADGPLHYWLGRHLEETGNHRSAEMAYQNSLAALPGNPAAWFVLADTRTKLGDLQGAMAAYEEVLRIFPANPAARSKLLELKKKAP